MPIYGHRTVIIKGAPTIGNTLFVDAAYGDDAEAEAGREDLAYATIKAAATAAPSGNLVVVGPGAYNENNVFRDSINYEFAPGASVDYGVAVDGAIFDDSSTGTNGKIIAQVTGGEFNNTGGTGGNSAVIWMENAASELQIDCISLDCTNSNAIPTIEQDDGILKLRCNLLSSHGLTFTYFWTNGECKIEAMDIKGESWPIWSEVGNGVAVTGELHIHAGNIIETGGQYAALTFNDDNSAARIWCYFDIVNGGTQAVIFGKASVVNGAKYYLTGQKMTYTSLAPGATDAVIYAQSGNAYLTVQKITLPDSAAAFGIKSVGSGTALLSGTIQVVECLGAADSILLLAAANMVFDLQLRYCIGAAATGGIKVTAGTLKLWDSRIDTSANATTSPVRVSGTGVVILQNVFLKAEGTQPSIKNIDAGAHTVYCYNCRTNRAVDANITVKGDLTVDATFI